MINKEEINLERAREGVLELTDGGGGFREELIKLKAVGELISYAGTDNAIVFQTEDVRTGIFYILRDIAREIEEGLEFVNEEIINKMRQVEPGRKEALR